MKRILALAVCVCLLLGGCTAALPQENVQKYTATFLDVFDTVTTVIGYAATEEEFNTVVQAIHDDLMRYHRLFDIYNDYEGITNLKKVNDAAGGSAVAVPAEIIELLSDCREYCELTGGKVNAAMGSVLRLWHDARSDALRDPSTAALPAMEALQSAAGHVGFEYIELDCENSTVRITNEAVRLDVGAVAKGWATQRAAEAAPEGMLISVGGNVCATGPRGNDGSPWIVGIMDPNDNSRNLHTLYVSGGSVVTSGDYQRGYVVDGKVYHHIIDPATLMPAEYWRSVTVVCEDSGLADALSTALFVMNEADGRALLEKCGADALWVSHDGSETMTEGIENILRT